MVRTLFFCCMALGLLILAGCGTGSAAAPAAPAGTASPQAAACSEPPGYMTFVINVHDTGHVGESAATILRLIGIFERYGVRGEFYLTADMVRLYAADYPEVLDRLKATGMGISYHVRAPHPLTAGFDQALQGLSGAQLTRALRDYETYRLDPATGGLIRSEAGGYQYVASMLGTKPVTVGLPTDDPRLKQAALDVYREMGATAAVFNHESGTKPDQPFEYRGGLLARPTDFSITRWTAPTMSVKSGANEPFWWNMLSGAHAEEYNPTRRLQEQMAAWKTPRPAFTNSLIHENNFYRSGAESWTLRYYADEEKSAPLTPPFNLAAPDPSKPRSQSDQDAIWTAYEEMVAYAAGHTAVVTAGDIVQLARASGTTGQVAAYCGADWRR